MSEVINYYKHGYTAMQIARQLNMSHFLVCKKISDYRKKQEQEKNVKQHNDN